jgi:16S rRNA U1498 N3-methylase RsmE
MIAINFVTSKDQKVLQKCEDLEREMEEALKQSKDPQVTTAQRKKLYNIYMKKYKQLDKYRNKHKDKLLAHPLK